MSRVLGAMTFVASLVLLGTPRSLSDRRAVVPGALLGAYDASTALWVAWRTGEPAANTFSHLMIGLMVAVVATAGFAIAAEAGLPRGLPSLRKGSQALPLAGALVAGLALGAVYWSHLLSEAPQLPEVMIGRGGGPIGAACLSLRSFLVEDVMYRVFLLSILLAASRRVFPGSPAAATASALAVMVLVMRWDPAHRTVAAAVTAGVYGLIYLRWGFGSLLAARLSAVLLAWPLARCLLS